MVTAEERSQERVAFRMDPKRAPYWSFHRQPPRPFWLDPGTQTISLGDERVWAHVPIHDPVWRMT